MKKIQKLVVIGLISCLWLLSSPLTTYGEEAKEPLVTDLSFDKESRILSGKTLPDVNISLADIVGSIPVAADGSFEIEVPEGIDKTTIAFADFINDQSTDIDYDFVIGDSYDPTAASSVKDTSENNLTTSSSNANQKETGVSGSPEQPASSKEEPNSPAKKLTTPMLLAIIALIILIILTILTLVLFARKKEKAAKELAEREASRSGRRKKRRRKKKSN